MSVPDSGNTAPDAVCAPGQKTQHGSGIHAVVRLAEKGTFAVDKRIGGDHQRVVSQGAIVRHDVADGAALPHRYGGDALCRIFQ